MIMEVDAWIPATLVLRAYREVQRQLLPGYNRPVSRRAIDLVNFVLRYRPATWPKLLDLWNSAHPADGYSDYPTHAFRLRKGSAVAPAAEVSTLSGSGG